MSQGFLNRLSVNRPDTAGFFGDELARVAQFYDGRPDLTPSPLRRLPLLAGWLGVGEVLIKDESSRFGLEAFKVVGVAYAVHRLLETGGASKGRTLVCASAGNHGRAVAHVARTEGLKARVYLSHATAPGPIEAIAAEGAEVVLVDGTYDDAVEEARRDGDRHGWVMLSDTAWAGYEQIPRWIMSGYTRIFEESQRQWRELAMTPDVLLVQAGVGSLAAAAVAWLVASGHTGVFSICCEPSSAAGLLASARAGRAVDVPEPLDTIMAGLRCARPSSLAVPILNDVCDAFVAIDDSDTRTAMRRLASEGVIAGPSGAAGVAALIALLRDESLREIREASRLGTRSVVYAINTEGATDRALYQTVIGKDAYHDSR